MPKSIYQGIPTIEMNGFRYIDPRVVYVDAFRVFTDPMRSYWVADKYFDRMNRLMKHYPLAIVDEKKTNFQKTNVEVLRYLKSILLQKNTILFFGLFCYNIYLKASKSAISDDYKKYKTNIPFFEIISTDFKKDTYHIYKFLKKKYRDAITYKQFYKFFQFTDKKVSFYHNNILILNIYGHNCKCIPYIKIRNTNIRIVTFHYMLMMFLVYYLDFYIRDHKKNMKNYEILISNIITVRKKYLDRMSLTPLDKSIFQEFKINCKGKTVSARREAQIRFIARKKQKLMIKWRYGPNDKNYKRIRFADSSGEIIKNKKEFVISKN